MKKANRLKLIQAIEQVRNIATNMHRAANVGLSLADAERKEVQDHIIDKLYSEIDYRVEQGEKEDKAVERAIENALFRVESWNLSAA